jgi:hypothetical protein
MTVWKDVELYDRGLSDFESLSPLERDYFVVKDLDIYYEMEGGFEDYILSEGHAAELTWLQGTLLRIGDISSMDLIKQIRGLNELQRAEMGALCDHYFALRQNRWLLLEKHISRHGVTVDENP